MRSTQISSGRGGDDHAGGPLQKGDRQLFRPTTYPSARPASSSSWVLQPATDAFTKHGFVFLIIYVYFYILLFLNVKDTSVSFHFNKDFIIIIFTKKLLITH